jgi:hypothetical protein
MRKLLFLLLIGCRTETVECSALQTCGSGAYKFCKQGAASCYYSLSDGSIISCTDCSNCRGALQTVNDWCSGLSLPDLSTTFSVLDLSVVGTSGNLSITKTGPPYTGSHTDPGLTDASQCPDANLEPNDGPDPTGHPLSFTPVPDQVTPKIVKLAICPNGPNPLVAGGQHDQDWFKIDFTTGLVQSTLMAEVFYDISMGDLDVAILDKNGNLLSVDGTAVTNACVSAFVTNSVYYVVVTGANNVDVNRYDILIRAFSTPKTCP